jgi:hypothetical protein
MKESTRSAEALLFAAYQEEAGRYAAALQVAEALRSGAGQTGTADEKLPQMLAHLDAVAAIEARIMETKRWWVATGQQPGPQLRAVLEQVTQLIERLAVCVRETELAALAEKQSLLPELDSAARVWQMQRAYGSGRTNRGPRSGV